MHIFVWQLWVSLCACSCLCSYNSGHFSMGSRKLYMLRCSTQKSTACGNCGTSTETVCTCDITSVPVFGAMLLSVRCAKYILLPVHVYRSCCLFGFCSINRVPSVKTDEGGVASKVEAGVGHSPRARINKRSRVPPFACICWSLYWFGVWKVDYRIPKIIGNLRCRCNFNVDLRSSQT